MIINELNSIISIVEEIVGRPKHSTNIDGWVEYNCPSCANIAGVDADGKYNLCINYSKGVYHCWKCEEKGRLSKLIRRHNGRELLRRYYNEINNIRNAKKFVFNTSNTILDDVFENEIELTLPDGCKDVVVNSKAYRYLKDRGLNDFFIKKFKLKYIGWEDSVNFKLRNRIIIPSYNMYGALNYWIGRDFSGKSKLKYCNAKIEKKNIIFNEFLVNWYENITLVEGVFDHMVIPNSIPLLGKKLGTDFAVYDALVKKAQANVNILLDDDATADAKRMYKILNKGVLRNRIKLIECRNGYDASLIYQKFGLNGVLTLMKRAKPIDEFDLLNF